MLRFLVLLGLVALSTVEARADFSLSQAWFVQQDAAERLLIQSDLILLGHYNRLVDGTFGPGTYNALIDYQSSQGVPADGVLSPATLKKMHAEADAAASRLGLFFVEEERSDTAIPVPQNVLQIQKDTDRGRSFTSEDGGIELQTIRRSSLDTTFDALFAKLSAKNRTRQITYTTYSDRQFVVSGTDTGRRFYLLFQNSSGTFRGFSLSWLPARESDAQVVAALLASYFLPLDVYRQTVVGDPAQTTPDEVKKEAAVEAIPEPGTEDIELMGSMAVLAGNEDIVILSGEITPSTPLEFLRALKAKPSATVVVLNSEGGAVDAGLIIAHEVFQRGLSTYVPEEAACLSACSFIYFAGKSRIASGSLGVHQVWNQSNDLVSGQAKLSDVLEALDEFGVDRGVISLMLRTPPQEMHVFTDKEIERFGINHGTPVEKAQDPQTELDLTGSIDPTTRISAEEQFKADLQAALDNYQTALNLAAAGDLLSAQTYGRNAEARINALCRNGGYPDIRSCLGQDLPALAGVGST